MTKSGRIFISNHALVRLRERKFPYYSMTEIERLAFELLKGATTVRRIAEGELRINRVQGIGFIIRKHVAVTAIRIH